MLFANLLSCFLPFFGIFVHWLLVSHCGLNIFHDWQLFSHQQGIFQTKIQSNSKFFSIFSPQTCLRSFFSTLILGDIIFFFVASYVESNEASAVFVSPVAWSFFDLFFCLVGTSLYVSLVPLNEWLTRYLVHHLLFLLWFLLFFAWSQTYWFSWYSYVYLMMYFTITSWITCMLRIFNFLYLWFTLQHWACCIWKDRLWPLLVNIQLIVLPFLRRNWSVVFITSSSTK